MVLNAHGVLFIFLHSTFFSYSLTCQRRPVVSNYLSTLQLPKLKTPPNQNIKGIDRVVQMVMTFFIFRQCTYSLVSWSFWSVCRKWQMPRSTILHTWYLPSFNCLTTGTILEIVYFFFSDHHENLQVYSEQVSRMQL